MTREIIDWIVVSFFVIILIPMVGVMYKIAFEELFCKRKNRKDL